MVNSFEKDIEADLDRFAGYSIDNRRDMKDFSDFKDGFLEEFGETMNKGGGKAFVSDDTLKKLFETQKVRNQIQLNVGDKKTKEVYEEVEKGEVGIMKTDGLPTQIVVVKYTSVKTYRKNGKSIHGYKKTIPHRWSSPQIRFIKIRKAKKITPKKIFEEYNKTFKDSPRSKSSVSSKVYRV